MIKLDRAGLESLWEEHCRYEFELKDADATIATMVENPYVLHIASGTGGRGREALRIFYREHFIPCLPDDTRIVPLNRTIDGNRLVDEFVFCATHDREIDFMLPGVTPTGEYFELPTVAIVTFEGDKIANEHIYWDQASLLHQIGLIKKTPLPIVGRYDIADLQ